jgi:hypothetical protein
MSVNIILQFVIPEATWLKHEAAITAKAKDHFGAIQPFDEYYHYCLKAHIDPKRLFVDKADQDAFAMGQFPNPNAKVISVMLPYYVTDFFWIDNLEFSDFPELESPISRTRTVDFYDQPTKEVPSCKVWADHMAFQVKSISQILREKNKEDKARYGQLLKRFNKVQLRLFCAMAIQYGLYRSVFWTTG